MPRFVDRFNVTYPIEPGTTARLTIGRDKNCDIQIPPTELPYECTGEETRERNMKTTLIIYTIGPDGQQIPVNGDPKKVITPYLTVSRCHATLNAATHTLENISERAVLVNRIPLRKGRSANLSNGAEIILGGLKLSYFLN